MTYLYDPANSAWENAACHGHPEPDHWFPPPGHGGTTDPTVRAAIAICRTCTLRAACLTHALQHHEPGIWGGTTERQRDELLRRQRRVAS